MFNKHFEIFERTQFILNILDLKKISYFARSMFFKARNSTPHHTKKQLNLIHVHLVNYMHTKYFFFKSRPKSID